MKKTNLDSVSIEQFGTQFKSQMFDMVLQKYTYYADRINTLNRSEWHAMNRSNIFASGKSGSVIFIGEPEFALNSSWA